MYLRKYSEIIIFAFIIIVTGINSFCVSLANLLKFIFNKYFQYPRGKKIECNLVKGNLS